MPCEKDFQQHPMSGSRLPWQTAGGPPFTLVPQSWGSISAGSAGKLALLIRAAHLHFTYQAGVQRLGTH